MKVRAHLLVPPHFLGFTAFKKMRWKDESGKSFPKLPNTLYDNDIIEPYNNIRGL